MLYIHQPHCNIARYLEGGVESGFNEVDLDAYVKKLFQVKGKNSVRIEQVRITITLFIDQVQLTRCSDKFVFS